ncbi:MAG TPA: glycosyltransferase [Vicinamibacterales bacterium]|nr:glycosyltransferase [Vicinamibacterales bacterium]
MAAADASVLICTFNRAALLGEALDSIAASRTRGTRTFEVLIVDNNSTDGTREAVASRQPSYPMRLRYLVEARQGKSYALNTGIDAAEGRVIVFGDDDQRFADFWIDEACAPLEADGDLAYTGGPVWPLWDAPPPSWLDLSRTEFRGPLGMFDYGPERFVLEDRHLPAGGGNMAVRRELFARIGGFSVELGRTGQSLLGQEQAEFFCRSRAAGARGLYVPSMEVFHHVPVPRLQKSYFRRWWYWRGISRARLDRLVGTAGDAAPVATLLGAPRYMLRSVLEDASGWISSWGVRRETDRLVHELHALYLAGYIREHRRRRRVVDPRAGAVRVG